MSRALKDRVANLERRIDYLAEANGLRTLEGTASCEGSEPAEEELSVGRVETCRPGSCLLVDVTIPEGAICVVGNGNVLVRGADGVVWEEKAGRLLFLTDENGVPTAVGDGTLAVLLHEVASNPVQDDDMISMPHLCAAGRLAVEKELDLNTRKLIEATGREPKELVVYRVRRHPGVVELPCDKGVKCGVVVFVQVGLAVVEVATRR